MTTTAELPEHKIFSVLRRGEDEPMGPYSQNELVELLNDRSILATDYVHYEGLKDWKLMSDVFNLDETIANFEDDGQNKDMLEAAFSQLNSVLGEGEDVFYIGVQDLPALRVTGPIRLTSPQSIAITNRRICIVHHRITGILEFEMHSFEDVCRATQQGGEGEKKATFSILLNAGNRVEIDKIPLIQLERLIHFAEAFNNNEKQADEQP
jgi:hypothetical protein